MNKSNFDDIKNLFKDGKLEFAIKHLLVLTQELPIYNDVLFQAARFSTFRKKKLRGITTNQDLELLHNSILFATIEIISEIERNTLKQQKKNNHKSHIKFQSIKIYTLIIFVFIFSFLGFVYMKKTTEILGNEWNVKNSKDKIGDSHYYHWRKDIYKKYGHLYTWVEAKQVCENLGSGWHLPNENEWLELAISFGGIEIVNDTVIGNPEKTYFALKEKGISGLDLLAGGRYEHKIKKIADMNIYGLYWSSSAYSNEEGWLFVLDNIDKTFYKDRYDKKDRASCRCIKHKNND